MASHKFLQVYVTCCNVSSMLLYSFFGFSSPIISQSYAQCRSPPDRWKYRPCTLCPQGTSSSKYVSNCRWRRSKSRAHNRTRGRDFCHRLESASKEYSEFGHPHCCSHCDERQRCHWKCCKSAGSPSLWRDSGAIKPSPWWAFSFE